MSVIPSSGPSPRRFAARTRPRLVLGGLAAAAGISLGGCDSAPDFQDAQFTSVSECTKAGFAAEVCEAGYKGAQEQQASAPKFNSLKSCEQEWGANHCQPYASTAAAAGNAPGAGVGAGSGSAIGNVFVPMLAGFVISQALQRRHYEGGGLGYYGGYGGYGSPIYRSRTGNAVVLDRSGGALRTTPVNVNTRTVSRSGFGGMSMSRNSGFGG